METITTAIGCCLVKRSARRTLAISVLPNGNVEVAAPLHAGIPEIQQKIAKRTGWILRQRRYFQEMHADRQERRYNTGATHRYLGRQYRLNVSAADVPLVKLRGGWLHIESPSVSSNAVAALLAAWMRARAAEQFGRRLEKWRTWCVDRALPAPSVHLLAMSKRWGSTRTKGRIYLNPELVRAPAPCIDYVITHEICHIKHPHHDRDFYTELEKLCPDWRMLKQRLESAEL